MHRRDSVIYAAYCPKLGGKVAVKVYQKNRTSASKLRAIKREAAIMVYLLKKRFVQRFNSVACTSCWPLILCMMLPCTQICCTFIMAAHTPMGTAVHACPRQF